MDEEISMSRRLASDPGLDISTDRIREMVKRAMPVELAVKRTRRDRKARTGWFRLLVPGSGVGGECSRSGLEVMVVEKLPLVGMGFGKVRIAIGRGCRVRTSQSPDRSLYPLSPCDCREKIGFGVDVKDVIPAIKLLASHARKPAPMNARDNDNGKGNFFKKQQPQRINIAKVRKKEATKRHVQKTVAKCTTASLSSCDSRLMRNSSRRWT
jgi:hypothetical protein